MVYLKMLLVPQGIALFKKNTSWQSNKKEHQSSNVQHPGRHVTFGKFVGMHTG